MLKELAKITIHHDILKDEKLMKTLEDAGFILVRVSEGYFDVTYIVAVEVSK